MPIAYVYFVAFVLGFCFGVFIIGITH
jgi:hypothetical protein